MTQRSLLAAAAISMGTLAVAQNQNWTATDINGNTHSIQDYLNQGKTVLVDISAHWCGPCWAWHKSGIMETLYHEFGPEGTNDLMIFFVDGDAASSMALLGGASGSQGNWIEGTPYPIIGPNGAGATLRQLYGVTAYPTLFMHCPGANQGTVIQRQATWQQFFQSWRNGCMTPFTNGANDATLLANPGVKLCPGESPKAILYNMGTNALASATVKIKQGNTVLQTVNWTGNLARWASAEVAFNQVTVTGTQVYTVEVSNPNGSPDDHPEGDTESYDFTMAPSAQLATVRLELKTDNYCEETSWKLYNSANQVVAQAGPYTQNSQDNTVFNYWWNLNPNECYRLDVLDSYGDGMCCSYGNGYYKLWSNGALITQGGQFGAVDKAPFVAGLTVGIYENSLENGLNLFPNPTNGQVTVELNLAASTNVRFAVMNVLGEQVMSTNHSLGMGAQQVTFDLGGLPTGSYFMHIMADGLTATRKLTVTH